MRWLTRRTRPLQTYSVQWSRHNTDGITQHQTNVQAHEMRDGGSGLEFLVNGVVVRYFSADTQVFAERIHADES